MPETPLTDHNKIQQESQYVPNQGFTPLPQVAFQNPSFNGISNTGSSANQIAGNLDELYARIDGARAKEGGPAMGGNNMYPVSAVQSDRYAHFLPGYNNEDIYGAGQGFFEKMASGVGKGLGIAGTTFVNGTVGLLYGTAKAINDGRFASLYDNELTQELDTWTKSLENTLPNYYTDRETNAAWYAPDNLLTGNFLWDKLIKNAGFALGAVAAGGAWGAGFKAIGLSGKLAQMGAALETSELAALEASLHGVASTERAAVYLDRLAALTTKAAGKALSKTDRILTAGFGTFGEAGMESLGSLNEFRSQAIEDYTKEHGAPPSGAELAEINQAADALGNTVFGLNTALLSMTNYIQFPKILGSTYKGEKNLLNRDLNRIVQTEAGDFAAAGFKNKLSRAYATAKGVGRLLLSPSEAFEEGSQSMIGFGAQNYYQKAYDKESPSLFKDLFGYGLAQTLSTKEGMESLLLGGLTGGLMEARSTVREQGITGQGGQRRVRTQTALDALNKSGRLKDYLSEQEATINRGQALQDERAAAIRQGDILQSKDLEFDFAHNYLQSRVKWGKIDSVQNEIATYRQLAASPQGWEQLRQDGIVLEGDTRESFEQRLTNIATHANFIKEHYEKINTFYGGLVDTRSGQRAYSDQIVDKMVYNAAKINDYDTRITALSLTTSLSHQLQVQSVLATATAWAKRPDAATEVGMRDAVAEVTGAIEALSIPALDKDILKQQIGDLMELGIRREFTLAEYDAMKRSPETFQDQAFNETFSEDDGHEEPVLLRGEDQDYILGRDYELKTAAAPHTVRQNKTDGRWEVKTPGGVLVDSLEERTAAEALATQLGQGATGLEKVTILGLAGDNFRVRDSAGKIRLVSKSFFSGHSLVQTEEEILAGSPTIREDVTRLQTELNDSSPVPTGDPALDLELIEKQNYDGRKKDVFQAVATASVSREYGIGSEHDSSEREQALFEHLVAHPEQRQGLKVIPVTFNTQEALGFNFIPKVYPNGKGADNASDPVNGAIALVYVREKDGVWMTVDQQGNPLQALGTPQSAADIIYTFLENADYDRGGTYKFHNAENRSAEEIADIREQAAANRKKLFESKELTPWEFEISAGRPNYELDGTGKVKKGVQNSVVASGIIAQEALSEKVWIEIPTIEAPEAKGTGKIIANGRHFYVPLGRPVLNRGTDLFYLNNRVLAPEEVEVIYQALLYISKKVFAGERLPEHIHNYIKNVIFANNKGGKAKFFFDGAGNLVLNGQKIVLAPSSIEANKAKITEFLSRTFHHVNKEKLGKGLFYEVTGFNAQGEPGYRVWSSYQHYLLSPVYEIEPGRDAAGEQGQPRTTPFPLSTKIQPRKNYKPGIPEPPLVQKYITLSNFFEYVPTVKKTPKTPVRKAPPAPAAGSYTYESPMGTQTIDGKTINHLEIGDNHIYYTAAVVGGDLEITVLPETTPGLLIPDADGNTKADVFVSSVLEGFVVPVTPDPTSPATSYRYEHPTKLGVQLIDGTTLNTLSLGDKTIIYTAAVEQGEVLITIQTGTSAELLIPDGDGNTMADKLVSGLLADFVVPKGLSGAHGPTLPAGTIVTQPTLPGQPTPAEAAAQIAAFQAAMAAAPPPGGNPNMNRFRMVVDQEQAVEATFEEASFRTWMAENLPQFNINVLKQVIRASGNGYAWGAQRAKYIYLYENAPAGTEYHEAFEAVWNSFLPRAEQEAIYAEFRRRPGTYMDRESGDTISFAQASEHQAKEQIAEEFAAFKDGVRVPGSPKKTGFFRRLLDFIRDFIYGSPLSIERLFNRIDSSYYRNATFLGDATTTAYSRIRSSGVPVSEVWLQDTMHLMTEQMLRRVIADGNLIRLSEGGLPAREVYDDLLTQLNWFYNDVSLNTAIPEAIRQRLLVGEGGFRGWFYVRDHWAEFVAEHQEFIKPLGLHFKQGPDAYTVQEAAEAGALSPQSAIEKELNKNLKEYDRDIFTQDAKGSITRAVRLIFSTLTEQTYPGDVNENLEATTPVISSVGGWRLVNADQEFYRVLNAVAGSPDIHVMEEKLRALAKTVPNLVRLYYRLFHKEPAARNKDDWKQITQFHAAMGLQSVGSILQLSNEAGETYMTEANNAQAVASLLERWSNEAKSSPLVGKHPADNTLVFDTTKIRTVVNSEATALAFLQELSFPVSGQLFGKLSAADRKALYQEVVNLYGLFKSTRYLSTDKGAGINKRLATLAGLIIKAEGDTTTASHLNGAGDLVQNNVLPNYVAKINSHINAVGSRAELLERLPHLADSFARHSLLLDPSRWNASGRISPLESIVLDGPKDAEGNFIPLSKLPAAARTMVEFNANLNGYYYSLIPADMKQEWGLKAGHYITMEDMAHDYQTPLNLIFRNYLIDEITLIREGETRRQNAQVGANNNYKKLRFFKDILSPELRTEVEAFANFPAAEQTIEAFVADQADRVAADVEAFMLKLILRQFTDLKAWRAIEQTDQGYQMHGLDTNFLDALGMRNGELTAEEVMAILRFRTMNYVIHNTELHKVYFQDPAQYKDATKRIKSFLSGRNPIYTNDPDFNRAMSAHFNTKGGRALKEGDPGYIRWGESFRALTVNHDEGTTAIVSRAYANIRENFYRAGLAQGMDPEAAAGYADREAAPYQEINEADGQSWRIGTSVVEEMMRTGGSLSADQEAFAEYDASYTRLALEQKGRYTYSDPALKAFDTERVTSRPAMPVTFFVTKPIGSGIVQRGDHAESNLLKTSTMPLFYSLLPEGSALQELYTWMWKNKVDYLGPQSQHKVGIGQVVPELYNKATGKINVEGLTALVDQAAFAFPWEHWGKQVETAGEHDGLTRISQLVALYQADMKSRGVPKDYAGSLDDWNALSGAQRMAASPIEALSRRNDAVLQELTRIGYDKLIAKLGLREQDGRWVLGDGEKFIGFLRDELTKRDVADNIKQALGAVYQPDTDTYELSTPLEALNNYSAVKNLIWSVADRNIVRPKMNGGAKIQISAAMWEQNARQGVYRPDEAPTTWKAVETYGSLSASEKATVRLTSSELNFYTLNEGDTEIQAMEVLLPNWFRKELARSPKYQAMDDEELLAELNSTEEGKSILRGVGARIPVQGMNSVEVFVVKGFLPAEMGDAVVVPSEITAKSGGDFDVDKLSLYLKNVFVDAAGTLQAYDYHEDLAVHNNAYSEVFFALLDLDMARAERSKDKVFSLQNVLSDLILEEGDARHRTKWLAVFRRLFGEAAMQEDRAIEQELIGWLENAQKKIDQLTDSDLQEVLLDQFLARARVKSLENEYFRTMEAMVLRPDNYARLLTVNRTTETKAVGDAIAAAKRTGKEEPAEKKNINYSDMLNPMHMTLTRHVFLTMKEGVGIGASQNKLFVMMQGADVKLQGYLKLPHNRVVEKSQYPGQRDITYISLSTAQDTGGMYVSDKNSQNLNGSVDAAKDPWLARQLGFFDILSTALFLNGAGVDLDHSYWFLNQPFIQAYMKERSIQKSLSILNPAFIPESNTQIERRIYKQFNLTDKELKEALPEVYEFELEELKEMVRDYARGINSKPYMQVVILQEFIKYQKMADALYTFGQGVSWDTARFSNGSLVDIKTAKHAQAQEGDIVGLEDLLDHSFVGAVKTAIEQTKKALAPVFHMESATARDLLSGVNEFYADPELRLSTDKKVAIMQRAELALLDYLLQNFVQVGGRPLRDYIPGYLLNAGNTSDRFVRLRPTLKGDLAQNPMLLRLSPVKQNSVLAPNNIGLIGKPQGAFEQNSLTAALRELRDNPNTADFYKALVLSGLLQSGVANSRISYNSLIPNEDYRVYLNQAIEALRTMAPDELRAFKDLNVFQRSNWMNNDIVPAVKGTWNPVRQALDYPYYHSSETKALGSSFILVRDGSRLARYPVVKIRDIATNPKTGQRYVPEEIVLMKRNKDFSYLVTRLYQRVEVDDLVIEDGEEEHLLYKQINAWGAGIYAQESYTDNRPSVLGTNEKVTEVPDSDIELAIFGPREEEDLNPEPPIGGDRFEALPEKYTRSTKKEEFEIAFRDGRALISGYRISFAGHPAFTTFVHKDEVGDWNWSDAKSGQRLGLSYSTIKDTLSFGIDLVNKHIQAGTYTELLGSLGLAQKDPIRSKWLANKDKIKEKYPNFTEEQFLAASEQEQTKILECLKITA